MSRADGGKERATRPPSFPGQPARWLHLVALSALAVLQPVLDQVASAPTFLVHHGATMPSAVLLTVALALGPPTLLWLAQAVAAALSERGGRAAQVASVAGLVALAAVPPLRRAGLADVAALAAAVAAGLLAGLAYRRWGPARSYLSLLAIGAVAFPLTFLMRGEMRDALSGQRAPAASANSVAAPELRLARPVVIVLFDELPLRSLVDERWQVDGNAFPGFARLAATSTWFRNFTTSHNETIGALPALLTGLRVGRAPPVTYASHPRNLLAAVPAEQRHAVFESETRFLPATGSGGLAAWRTGVVLADLAALFGRLVLPGHWAGRLPEVGQQWGHFWSRGELPAHAESPGAPDWAIDERARRFAQFLDQLAAAEGPGLAYAHVMLPHSPWQVLPSGRLYRWRGVKVRHELPARLSRLSQRASDPVYLRFERQRHLLQVQFADRLLLRLLDRLEELGSLDDTVLVVLSDHGRNFAPGSDGRSLEGARDHESVARVPLFVKEPGQRQGRVIDRNVESIDFLETLADAAGSSLPWPTEGESGYAPGPGRAVKVCFDRYGVEHRGPAQFAWPDPGAIERGVGAPATGDPFQFFRLGPYRDLVGRSLDDLAPEDDTAVELELAGGEELADFDPAASFRPVYLLGRARWPPSGTGTSDPGTGGARSRAGLDDSDGLDGLASLHLAFALGRRIVAVTQTLSPVAVPGAAEGEVLVLLPEGELVPGRNELAVFAVAGSVAEPRLCPATLEWRR